MYAKIRDKCLLIDHPFMQNFILGVIIFNAIILGMETSPVLTDRIGGLLNVLDYICLGIYVVEILMKLVAYRFSFFKSGWNIFDFLIVAISLLPGSGPLAILRVLRIMRVSRLVTNLPRLRMIVESVFRSLPGIGWISSLLLIIFYIFSVLTTYLFGGAFPEWFGNIGASMYTLFQVMTLESWSMGIVRPVVEIYPYAVAVFVPFIMMTAFIVLNVFIGIIVGAMGEVAEAQKAEAEKKASDSPDALKKELALLKAQIEKVEKLLESK